MQEIRFHGRGGQGAVTSAELFAIAAIASGKYAQAFPSFGPERRGAPVVAFCRVDDKKINIRAKIYYPNVVMVLDAGLLELVNPLEGIKEGGILIVNTKKAVAQLKNEKFPRSIKIAAVDANTIAQQELGRVIVNTTMLGALIKATGIITIEDIKAPIMERFGAKLGERNLKALERAYHEVKIEG